MCLEYIGNTGSNQLVMQVFVFSRNILAFYFSGISIMQNT